MTLKANQRWLTIEEQELNQIFVNLSLNPCKSSSKKLTQNLALNMKSGIDFDTQCKSITKWNTYYKYFNKLSFV